MVICVQHYFSRRRVCSDTHEIIQQRAENNYNSYERAALQDWFPVAVAYLEMRLGLLLCASNSLYARTDALRSYHFALRYKAACIHMLSDAINTRISNTQSSFAPKIDDATISMAVQLASDECAARDSIAGKTHINATGEMVKLNGDLDNIKSMNSFLKKMVEALKSKHQHQKMTTARSDTNDDLKLYRLEHFFRQ